MTPPSSSIVPPDGGGTAIISLSSLAATNSVHMALVFNGVFVPSDVADVPLAVRLEDNEQIIHEEVGPDLNGFLFPTYNLFFLDHSGD